MERWTGSAPPACGESSAGSRSRRKAPAGRPTSPFIRLSVGGHRRGRIGPGGGVDGHGRWYQNFCKPTCKVRWLAFVHGQGDHDEARTAYRVGEGELIAAHHAARARAGRAGRPRHFHVDCSGILRTVHTHHRLSAERRGQGTIQPARGWGAAYMSGRSKPLSAAKADIGDGYQARAAGGAANGPHTERERRPEMDGRSGAS